MRRRLALAAALLAMLAAPLTAKGETEEERLYAAQWQSAGMDGLWDDLPAETRDLLRQWGVNDLAGVGQLGADPQTSLERLWGVLSGQSAGPLAAGATVLGVALLCALLEGIGRGSVPDGMASLFSTAGAVASCAAVTAPLTVCVDRVRQAVESCGVFAAGYVPAYAGILLANGQAAAAVSYQSITLFAAQTLTWLTGRVVVPCLVISLAFGLTGAAAPDMRLPAVGGALSKGASWLMGVSATVFVGLLTLRGAVTSAADSLGGRAIRFSLASFVPVVGGAMGEAFNAIRGCLYALRATAGAVGVAATGLIVLPPLAECVGWALTLGICGTAAEMLALPSLSGLLKAAQGVIKALIAALLCCGLFLIVATTLVTLAKSGGG